MATFHECKQNLKNLMEGLELNSNMNEAQTRFHIIDELIIKCFDWPKEYISIENYENKQFTDYELGKPRQMIWEAKREGSSFSFPPDIFKNIRVDLPSIMDYSNEIKEAIIQVQGYCSSRGVGIANVTNGHQHIIFLASRIDGIAPLNAKALIFKDLNDIYNHFDFAWAMLSFQGILERNILSFLQKDTPNIPSKLSKKLINYPKIRYSTTIQQSLRQLSELLIQDITEK